MAFTIPNFATAAFPAQSEPDKVDFEILTAGVSGSGVISGLGTAANNSGVNLSVLVSTGIMTLLNGVPYTAPSVVLTPAVADSTYARFDLVCCQFGIGSQLVTGTPAAIPVFPSIPFVAIVLAALYVPASASSITSANLVDKRVVISPTTKLTVVTASATATASANTLILADATSAAFTITLPTAVSISGQEVQVKRVNGGTNPVTVVGPFSETIDDEPAFILSKSKDHARFVSNGNNWIVG